MFKRKNKVGIYFYIVLLVLIGIGAGFAVSAYQSVFAVNLSLAKNINIGCSDAIEIDFSQPMLVDGIAENINIQPKTDVTYLWSEKNKRFLIKPIAGWLPDTHYEITLSGARSAFLVQVNSLLSFKTLPYPHIKYFSPIDNEKDVFLDIENPIVVYFEGLSKKWDIKFVINPSGDLTYVRDNDKGQILLTPRSDLIEGEKYSVRIYAKYFTQEAEEYKQIYESSFETKKILPPENWDSDPQIKLQQAKNNTVAYMKDGKYIDINLAKQVMVIFENGKALDSYLISSGKSGMETKEGVFAIHNKAEKPWSKKYSLFMPYWMALVPSGEFGIHELPEWPGGYKEGAGHLGIPVSHGCVRLGIGSAKRVFDWAQIGTPVLIHS